MTYFDRYEIRNGTTYVYRKKPDSSEEIEYELCEDIRVVSRKKVMYEKNNPIVVDVLINNEPNAKPIVGIPRSTIVKSPIDFFADYGLNISNLNEYNVTLGEVLQDTEKSVPIQREYDKLGYIISNKKLYFAASSIYPENHTLCLKKGTATKSKGTFESWREELLPYIEDNEYLQLALAISASAPTLKLLQYYNIIHESMMFSYIGESSSGKTLALSLGASIYGKPTISDGIIDTMIDTENYFFSQLSVKNGVAHFVDEATLETRMDFTKKIYQVSMQHERGRLNGDGTPKEARTWVSTVIFTGERSILDMTNGNAGLTARMIEFYHKWTHDGDSADSIYKIINSNYGTAWLPLVQGLTELKKSGLICIYNNNLNYLKAQVASGEGIGNRILSKFAVILATIDVLQEAWQIKFDKEKILQILIEKHNDVVKSDIVFETYDKLLSHIVQNGKLFPKPYKANGCCDDIFLSGNKHGIISTYNNRKCIWMIKDKFEEFIKTVPNVNLKMIRKSFKERGYIAYFDESYLRQQQVDTAKVSCYCIFLDSNDRPVKANPSKKKRKNQYKHLIADDDE